MRIVKEHDERRGELIDTAQELFLTKGYEKTTINDILKAVGIAKGTFYYYFASKEEVMEAVIKKIADEDLVIAKEIASRHQLGALERILLFLSAQSSDASDEKRELIREFPKVENALLKQRALEATLKYVCPILAEIIEEGNRTKEFDAPFPLESIQFLIAGIQTMMDERMLETDREVMAKRLKAFAEVIYRVLGINEEIAPKQAIVAQFEAILTV